MNLLENLKLTYKNGNTLTKLIYFNVAVFIVVKVFLIFFRLFNVDVSMYLNWLAVPANFTDLGRRFWTPLTYMFMHKDFMHIFFNMLMLFWFGKIFLMYYSEKQLLALYLFGGLIGAFIYILAYNFFPYYETASYYTIVIGASGAVMAIIVADAVKSPNAELQLMFIGKVKLIYIAIVTVLISVFGITGENGGGEMVHLGGALAGYLFATLEKKGKDITPFFNKIIDFFVNLFRRRETKFKTTTYHTPKMSDGDYNQQKANTEAELDRILDKIKTSGYESLTADEKRKLFEQKK
ncbi:Rhomboid family protein [uncultured Paludibacter sp.]|uniref:Rhomboid family protein n=1 Tax=uncultured Paludibacter sp. TaxID=497635 RepID=A0A653AJL9_9BACT|nr:Rhomboid family protein [uncultured Paludibacter sp.]